VERNKVFGHIYEKKLAIYTVNSKKYTNVNKDYRNHVRRIRYKVNVLAEPLTVVCLTPR